MKNTNKKGWIRIVEAFTAVLLISGVALLVIDSRDSRENAENPIQNSQLSILRNAQLNDSIRTEVISTSEKVLWEGFSSQAPQTKKEIESETISGFECNAQICDPSDLCSFENTVQKNIFAESIVISSDLNTFNPRVLKLFCWEK